MVYRAGTTVAHTQAQRDGSFTFNASAGEYQLIVRAPGFAVLRSSPVPFAPGSVSSFQLQIAQESGPELIQPPEPPLPTQPVSSQGLLEESAVKQVAAHSSWEYGVLAQGGFGVEDRSSFKFLLVGGHAGKILTPNLGSGLFQGNFEYAVEVFPFWQSYTPKFQRLSCTSPVPNPNVQTCSPPYTVGGTYTGVSITPILLRWNLTHGERWMPWLQGAGGVVWTNHKYPAVGDLNPADTAGNGPGGDTSVWNFTPQFGIGTHYFLKSRRAGAQSPRSLDFSANAVHISSASLGDKNPGVNASVQFSVGYTWWK